MGFNPEYHYRRSVRLPNHNYSEPGAYFVTICTQNRSHYFGDIRDGQMILNSAGEVVDFFWQQIPEFNRGAVLCNHIVMPNHIHGIIHLTYLDSDINLNYIESSVGADLRVCPDLNATTKTSRQQDPGQAQRSTRTERASLPTIIRRFKSITTTQYIDGIHAQSWPALNQRLWQRNYHEHVIRSESAYLKIARYIEANPLLWADDVYYKTSLE